MYYWQRWLANIKSDNIGMINEEKYIIMPALYVQHVPEIVFIMGIRKEVRISFQRSDNVPFNRKTM